MTPEKLQRSEGDGNNSISGETAEKGDAKNLNRQVRDDLGVVLDSDPLSEGLLWLPPRQD